MNGASRSTRAAFIASILALFALVTNSAQATSYSVKAGDTVVVTGSYSSSDPDDPAENEPLVVSAGPCSFTTFGTVSCQTSITADGTFTVTYYVQGGDGDETVNVTVDIIHGPVQPCPVGSGGFGGTCTPRPTDDGKNDNSNTCNGSSGDPVFPGDGNVHEDEVDFDGPGMLKLVRSYNTRTGWLHSFLNRLIFSGQTAEALRPDGSSFLFTASSSSWSKDPDVAYTLTTLPAGDPSGATYKLVTDQDGIELYDAGGLPLSTTERGGASISMAYQSSLLSSVTDAFGRQLTFRYDSSKRLVGFTTPAGESYGYNYDSQGRLAGVIYPDSTTRQYVYEDTQYPFILTGTIDELGNRLATWTFDQFGRALTVEEAGGVNKYQFAYQSDDRFVDVTDPLGTVRTLEFQNAYGRLLLTSSDLPCATYGQDIADKTVGDNGLVTQITDYKSVSTNYGYDYTRDLVTTITRAAGTSVQQQTTIQYSSSFRLPVLIQSPGLKDQRTYDTLGNLIQRTLTDTATSVARTTKYTYNSHGQVLASVDPDGNVTTFTYDGSGDLASITDALGHVSSYQHDADGRMISMTDPNGLVTKYVYDARGRLTAKTVGQETYGYSYDAAGDLLSTTQPNGFALTFSYDAAHRLIGTDDIFGDHLDFTLDDMGNRVSEDLYDPSNALAYEHDRVIDSLGRLQEDLGSQGQTTTYAYDANSNLTSIQDPLGHSTQLAYDALNRQSKVTQADTGITQLAYDALDHLISVTDPRGSITKYQWNALGDALGTQSPDAGNRQTTFDAAGSALTRTDARAQVTHYTYDALQRPTGVTYADGQIVTYTYDHGQYGIGHLTGMTDASGSTTFAYDLYGRLAQRSQQITGNSRPLTTRYQYAPGGQISELTYPSGKKVTYSYDRGRLTKVTGNAIALVRQITYNALGRIDGWKFWNGQTVFRDYDNDGRMTRNELATYGLDLAGRIAQLDVQGKSPASYTVGYDSMNRVAGFGTQSFTYDTNGNRLTSSDGTTPTQYAFATGSNRLTGITTAGVPRAITTDANGSMLTDGQRTLAYDAAGRLSQANGAAYLYNGLGERVQKTVSAASTSFIYGVTPGQLLGQYGSTDRQETVWIEDIPVVVMSQLTNYAIHSDQLNTPRQINNEVGKIVWQLGYDAFGQAQATGSLTYNLRFPGQYYDAETGLNYNAFRDYDPSTGRYVESDPIGLMGGLNDFAYAHNGPLNKRDPSGLCDDGHPPHRRPLPPIYDPPIEPTISPLDLLAVPIGLGVATAVEVISAVSLRQWGMSVLLSGSLLGEEASLVPEAAMVEQMESIEAAREGAAMEPWAKALYPTKIPPPQP